mgnify:CR=1 FL=1
MANKTLSGWTDDLNRDIERIGNWYKAQEVDVAPPQFARKNEISDSKVVRLLIERMIQEIEAPKVSK